MILILIAISSALAFGHRSFRDVHDLEQLNQFEKQSYNYNKEYHPQRLLKWSELRETSDKMLSAFRMNIEGVVFSGVFSDYAVLQRGPEHAALFGAADSGGATIIVTMTDNGSSKEYVMYATSSNEMDKNGQIGDWKVIIPQPFPNGGNYSLKAECIGCKSNKTDTLHYLTFGDVYYCSGQSNMELDMHYTFRRNYSYDRIAAGYYSNIRYFLMNEIDTSNETYIVPLNGNKQYQWGLSNNVTLDTFSAPCWYFAQSLYDNFSMTDTNIGIISVAVGGSMIEQWTKNDTVQLNCQGSTCPSPLCGGLYNGLVASFLNMTIKAALWYQGENNICETPQTQTLLDGYGCMEQFMLKQWRQEWSLIPQTTNSLFPFGIVTLAGGTDEGCQQMPQFRLAQTALYNYVPNEQLPNTFMALAHDLGDPWSSQCYYLRPSPCFWNMTFYYEPYSLYQTGYYMGSIHPRVKIQVGQRLARAGYNMLYPTDTKMKGLMSIGPLLSSCKLDNITETITLYFNKTFLNGNNVLVEKPYIWYNESIMDTISDWSAVEVYDNNARNWYFANITQGTQGNDVVVNVSFILKENHEITQIRYAQSTYPCCGNLNIKYNPCPPDACPIKAADPMFNNQTLPGVPFIANIINETCFCTSPETCTY